MNKFNAIKILEEEKKESLMANRNLGKEDFMEKLETFIENFVNSKLTKLNNNGIIKFDNNSKDENTILNTLTLNDYISEIANSIALGVSFDGSEDIENIEEYENFIYRDKVEKEKVANIIIDHIQKHFSN